MGVALTDSYDPKRSLFEQFAGKEAGLGDQDGRVSFYDERKPDL
jgi:hypothetical protein